MAYTVIDDSSDYFNTKLYTGNGGTQNITGVGHQVDWTWIKHRGDTEGHGLFDVVRGALYRLQSSGTTVSSSQSGTVTAFGSDGFSIGNNAEVNANTASYVSWNWKAGTSFSNDASSTSIGSIDSSGSVSTTSGFSIIKWSGANATSTVAHGLGVAPKVLLVKSLANTTTWMVQHAGIGNAKEIYLNNDSAAGNSTAWNSTSPTTTVFTVTGGAGDGVNHSGDYIAYCFAEVKGFSKFGSYIGNGNANGTFVYTGFKPAWVLARSISASRNWNMYDNKRPGHNGKDAPLFADLTNAESNDLGRIDFVSNGFKIRTSNLQLNTSGTTYIFMAFAENPLVNSSGVPGTAE